MRIHTALMALVVTGMFLCPVYAQETGVVQDPPPATEKGEGISDSDVADQLEKQVRDIGKTLDQSETVQEVSAGILKPIYDVAEWMSFPAFYWLAFMLMVAGVVSFAGQLVFAKLLLLLRGNLNIEETLGDLLGFLISGVGLILTTQAATENSSFTGSPASVVSAAAVGAVTGLVFYWWGQRQELNAARGARQLEKPSRKARM